MTNIHRDKGYGFIAQGKLYLVRCFKCGKENYAPTVARGYCAWCGDTPDAYKLIKEELNHGG